MYTRRGAGHEECITGGVQDMRNGYQEGCRTLGMYNRRGAEHEECIPGGVQDMRNVYQKGCRT